MAHNVLNFIQVPNEIQYRINQYTRDYQLQIGIVLESGPNHRASGVYAVKLDTGEQVDAVYHTSRWSGIGITSSIEPHTPVFVHKLAGATSQYIIVGFVPFQPDQQSVIKDGELFKPTLEAVYKTGVNFFNGFHVLTEAAADGFLGIIDVGAHLGTDLGKGAVALPGTVDYRNAVGDRISVTPGVHTTISSFEAVHQSNGLRTLDEVTLEQSELLKERLKQALEAARPRDIEIQPTGLTVPKDPAGLFYVPPADTSEYLTKELLQKVELETEEEYNRLGQFQETLNTEISKIPFVSSSPLLSSSLSRLSSVLGLNINLIGTSLEIGNILRIDGDTLTYINSVIDLVHGDLTVLNTISKQLDLPVTLVSGTLSLGPIQYNLHTHNFSLNSFSIKNQVDYLLGPINTFLGKALYVVEDISEVIPPDAGINTIIAHLPPLYTVTSNPIEPRDPNQSTRYE